MKTQRKNNNFIYGITTVFTVVMLFFITSCGGNDTEVMKTTPKREKLPVLKAANITTIISDSGITRFRITTPEWLVYDKVKEPYWDFPKGIDFERFDEQYNIDANMKSDRARYLQGKLLWEFNDNVVATNIKGEIFETDQLFWDDAKDKFYSDKKIKITQKKRIIMGIGFESNASLTHYIIRQTKGIIPIEQENAK